MSIQQSEFGWFFNWSCYSEVKGFSISTLKSLLCNSGEGNQQQTTYPMPPPLWLHSQQPPQHMNSPCSLLEQKQKSSIMRTRKVFCIFDSGNMLIVFHKLVRCLDVAAIRSLPHQSLFLPGTKQNKRSPRTSWKELRNDT